MRQRASTMNIKAATRQCSSTASRSTSRSRGSKMLLPTFLDAFQTASSTPRPRTSTFSCGRTRKKPAPPSSGSFWGPSARALPPSSSPPAEQIWQTSARSRRSCRSCLLNRTLPNYSYVGFDQLESGRLAAEHALKRGGDSILLVSSPTLFGTSWRSSAIFPTTACSTA